MLRGFSGSNSQLLPEGRLADDPGQEDNSLPAPSSQNDVVGGRNTHTLSSVLMAPDGQT